MLYLCRLCLKKSEFCFSLFTGNIVEQIESLTSIKIVKDDDFPQTCCESCMTNVYSAYNFQQCVINADKTLHELHYLKPAEIKIEEVYAAEEDDNDNSSVKNEDNSNSNSEITDVVMLEDKDNIYEFNFLTDDVKSNEVSELLNKLKESEEVEEEEYMDDPHLEKDKSGDQTENKTLHCTTCDLKFDSKRLLQQHMAKHRVDSCPYCFIVMRRDNLKKHIQIHEESPEVCEICGKVAKNKESLRGHINYLHKKKAKTKCDYCEKEFKSTHHYNSHVRNVHLGIRNHQCHICGKKFFANRDLNKHINMTHKRARPYVCPYCTKGFSSPYARKTHIRVHTQETPYRCEICSAGFRQKVSLITHIRNKHQNLKGGGVKSEDECEMLDDN